MAPPPGFPTERTTAPAEAPEMLGHQVEDIDSNDEAEAANETQEIEDTTPYYDEDSERSDDEEGDENEAEG